MTSTLPITVSDLDFGTFETNGVETTPLTKIAVRMAEATLNTTWAEAQTQKGDLDTKIAAAKADILSQAATAPTITAGSVTAPTITAPTVSEVDSADVVALFDAKSDELIGDLITRFSGFISTHFPDDATAYAAAQDWVSDAIANGGLPAALEDSLYETERSKILIDASRASDAVLATFAARGFEVPPGAALGAVREIQQKAQEANSAAAGRISAIKVEAIKFAVERAVTMRQAALGAAIEYIKALSIGGELATKVTSTGYGEQARLISAAADFYRADASAKEMVSKVAEFNVGASMDASKANQAASMSIINSRIETLLTEIKILGSSVTSLYNNLHASTGINVSI